MGTLYMRGWLNEIATAGTSGFLGGLRWALGGPRLRMWKPLLRYEYQTSPAFLGLTALAFHRLQVVSSYTMEQANSSCTFLKL